MFVVVGLGNPGSAYAATRHNLGYAVVQAFAQELSWNFTKGASFEAQVAKGNFEGKTLHLLLPTTYMNASGRAIQRYLHYHKLLPNTLIVICDDVELPLGTLRWRIKGSSGGHNGLLSIQQELGTMEYGRLRLGIGRPSIGKPLEDYVLEPFTLDEMPLIQKLIESAIHMVKAKIGEDPA